MTYLFLSLILALLTSAFALQNTEAVTVRLLLWEYQTSLVLVILGSAGVGIVLTFLASLGRRFRRGHTIRSLQSTVELQGARIRELEESLRVSPRDTHRRRESKARDARPPAVAGGQDRLVSRRSAVKPPRG